MQDAPAQAVLLEVLLAERDRVEVEDRQLLIIEVQELPEAQLRVEVQHQDQEHV